MASEDDSIEQAVAERRERLRALKTAQELLSQDGDPAQAENGSEHADVAEDENLSMKFRNYLPHDKQLQEGKLAPPDLPKFDDPVAAAPLDEKKEDPFLNIAPKKPNWDLKRDVQKKLDKLEKRTQRALFKLMEQQQQQNQLEDGENDARD